MPRPVGLLPKAHLHLHFTGSMRLATLMELARKHGIRLPDALTGSWPPVLSLEDERGWFRFQRLYDMARACVRDESDMRRIVREAAADDAAEGSRWLEIQVDPTSYAPFVGGLTPALEIILDEARCATEDAGIGVAVIVAASRVALVRVYAGRQEPGPASRGLVPAVPVRAVGPEHLSKELLDAPGGADLLGRVVGLEDGLQPGQGRGAQLVAGTQQETAVCPGRVDLHPTSALLLVLDPLADVGEHRVG